MAALALLQPDARASARLGAALGGVHEVVVRPSWKTLHRSLGMDEVEGCIVDADHPNREAAAARIRRLRAVYPFVAVVAYADLRKHIEYFDFGELGVHGVLPAGAEAAQVRTVVDRALLSSRAARVAAALEGRFGDIGPRAVAWAMEHGGAGTTVDEFAAGLGQSTASLTGALRDAGLPGPARLLVWGRLLHAGAALSRDGDSVEQAAYRVGYAGASSLARAMKRHTGFTPREVADRGGVPCVQDALFPRTRPRGRTRRGLRSVCVAGALLVSGCAGLGLGTGAATRRAIDEVLDAPPLDQVHFGVLAIDARTGSTLYARNAHRKFVPASNQKILVTAAAMSLLGPEYRYRTEVWATGSALGSLLDGDLVLLGTGDPTLSGRYWESGSRALRALADSVRATGLQSVTGSLFVDVSAWDSSSVGPTWEVEDLAFAYGSTGGAFAIDEGEVRVVVTAGAAVGSPATYTWSPVGTEDFVTGRLTTAPPDSATRVRPSYLPESRRLVLEGRVAWGRTDTLSFAIRDPVRQAAAAFARALADAGVTVESGWHVVWADSLRVGRGCLSGSVRTCRNAGRVAGIESPGLADIVEGILEPSQNWMTEQLVRTLGAELGKEGSWNEGLEVISGFLGDSVAVDSLDVAPRDGSGLSAYNLVTPRAVVRVLEYMRFGPHAQLYRQAMAEPGEEDSSLERRLDGLEDRVFAKTGTISNVNSLSGYLVREDGTEVIFSILSNGSGLPSARVREGIDDVVRILAR